MALTQAQTDKIDEMIGNNAKRLDIIDELVGKHKASAAEVEEYINTMARRINNAYSELIGLFGGEPT